MQKALDLLKQPEFIARHRTRDTAFTRQRKLPFWNLCLILLNQLKGSLQDELDAFFQAQSGRIDEERIVSKSALSQARQYLSHTAFIELLDNFQQQFDAQATPWRWYNLRLRAVDGSTLYLPDNEATFMHFGGQQQEGVRCTQARMSECYDIASGLTVDCQVAPYATAERDLAAMHLAKTQADDILLYDRGYPAFWFYVLHQQEQRYFCMRMSKDLYPESARLCRSKEQEMQITLTPKGESIKQCKKRNLPRQPITLRLVKVVLDNGSIEILITNLLDSQRYPATAFKELYHYRWGIEENYKRQKSRQEVENFSGTSVAAIYQDIYAKCFIKNVAMALVTLAQTTVKRWHANRQHRYQVNVTQALSKMKHFLVTFQRAADPVLWLEKLVRLLGQTTEPIRPHRSYPHKLKRKSPNRFSVCYKRIR